MAIGGTYLLGGLWGIGMVAIFIQAVEARSPQLSNTSGVPRKAMIFHTVANWNVARDAETQALRRRMNQLLTVNLLGFILLWALVWWAGATGN